VSDAEHPEDERPSDQEQTPAGEETVAEPEPPVAAQPEQPAAAGAAAELEQPVAAGVPSESEQPVAAGVPSESEQPVAAGAPPEPEQPAASDAPAGEPELIAKDVDVIAEADSEVIMEGEPVSEAEAFEEEELAPRVKPEIPGADLIPDIVSEGDEFLDAEAQAAAEAEAEAAAAQAEVADQEEAQPIANAAIDLAAGARYTATGKRKTAVARVILKPGTGTYSINGKPLDVFFPRETLQRMIRHPLETVGYEARMDVVARMHGGGVSAQAGALRHGISRALIVADPQLRGELKRRGFLTRDPRVKERKKAGLKKARKRPQFSKR
jgi:small subunit ribosomal protein S9